MSQEPKPNSSSANGDLRPVASATAAPDGGRPRRPAWSGKVKDWAFAAALFLAVVFTYQPAWQGGFVWEDDALVPRPELRSSHGLYRVWFDVLATEQYYPLSFSALWVEHRLWGDATLGYHLVNIFLHATAALTVILILRRLAVPGACLAAAIFALHPVHVESVAWITELKNTLSGVFYLGAMLLYLHFDQARKPRWYLGALGLFMLALLSKTATVMLPAVLPVIFWWQRGRLSWKRDLLPLAPFFLVGAMAGVLTVWVERKTGAVDQEFNLAIVERCLLAGRAIWFYLGKLFWPVDLTFIYPRWNVSRTLCWQYLFPAAALLLLAVSWRLRRRWRAPLAGLLFFAATLIPVLGFLNVFFFQYSFVADHFQYLASLGIITLFSAGVALLLERAVGWGRIMGQMGCLALLAALAVLSWRQSRMYADIETLYRTTIDRNPDCWMAYNNLGNALAGRGRLDEAIAHYQKALEIKPDYAAAHNNLGLILVGRGQFDEAVAHFGKALEIQPGLAVAHYDLGTALAGRGRVDEAHCPLPQGRGNPARLCHGLQQPRQRPGRPGTDRRGDRPVPKGPENRPRLRGAHNNLGTALVGRGQVEEAIAHYRKALEIQPDFVDAHYNLGLALAGGRQFEEAIAQYRTVLDIQPGYLHAYNSLGNALASGGQFDEAIAQYRKALKVKPDYAEAHYNLGLVLTNQGQVDEAIAHYQKAVEIKPDYAEAHYNLGLALAGGGQVDKAIAHYEKAAEIKPDYVAAHYNLGNVLFGHGRVEEAIAHYRKVLELKPDYAEAHNNLGLALAGCGRIDEAIVQYRKALEIKPDYLQAHYNLGVALAGRGKRDEALEHYQEALDLASARNDRALADVIRAQIKRDQSVAPGGKGP